MRFLILCLLIYVGYRTLKALIVPHESSSRPETQDELTRVDDVMIKDPFCKTYFPKRSGIKAVINGETCYFCSTACRDKYLEQSKKPSR
jgi:YHS domain-containing protein